MSRLSFILIPLLLFSQLALAMADDNLDAVLQTALRRYKSADWRGRVAGQTTDDKIKVLVKIESEAVATSFHRLGAHVSSKHGDIWVVDVPLSKLLELSGVPGVIHIEASQYLRSKLDEAALPTGANRTPLTVDRPDVTGRGVLVGVIDSGIDTTLPAFKEADGGSRVVAYWDYGAQGQPPSVTFADGETRTFDFGADFSKADIDEGRFVGKDTDGHGTHVAGIAAGKDPEFPGMAPESSLIAVLNDGAELENGNDIYNLIGSGPNLDAYSYLIGKRDEIGLPLVVNQSQGTGMGPHDGSTLFEQALQNDIDDHGFVICISSGNERQDQHHGQDTIPANGAAEVDFAFQQNEAEYDRFLANSVDVWFDRGTEPQITIELYPDATFSAPIGTVGPIGFQESGQYAIPNTTRSVTIDKELPSALNGENHFFLTFAGEEAEVLFFRIRLENSSGQAGVVDLYLQDGSESHFRSDISDGSGSLGAPSTTPGAITVGAFSTRQSFPNALGTTSETNGVLFDIAPFSSIGPPRNLNLYQGANSVKPDIAAPGVFVISQLSSAIDPEDSDPEQIFQDQTHLVLSGTSMATPVVTGVVALMLQDNPIATPEQIKTWLNQTARSDSFTGTTPNNEWGHGKIDAKAAFDAVVSPKPDLLELESLAPEDTQQRYRIVGRNMALTHQILVNGVALPAEQIQWNNHREIEFELPGDETVDVLTLINTKAPTGQDSDSLILTQSDVPVFVPDESNGFCFIATAAYGSSLDPKVIILRQFRDRYLLTNNAGRLFVKAYYSASPAIAQVIAQNGTLRAGTRYALIPVVFAVEHLYLTAVALLLLVICFGWEARRRILANR